MRRRTRRTRNATLKSYNANAEFRQRRRVGAMAGTVESRVKVPTGEIHRMRELSLEVGRRSATVTAPAPAADKLAIHPEV